MSRELASRFDCPRPHRAPPAPRSQHWQLCRPAYAWWQVFHRSVAGRSCRIRSAQHQRPGVGIGVRAPTKCGGSVLPLCALHHDVARSSVLSALVHTQNAANACVSILQVYIVDRMPKAEVFRLCRNRQQCYRMLDEVGGILAVTCGRCCCSGDACKRSQMVTSADRRQPRRQSSFHSGQKRKPDGHAGHHPHISVGLLVIFRPRLLCHGPTLGPLPGPVRLDP